MPSEWSMKSAQGIVRPLKARIYQQMTALDYDDTWNRIADALDAARKQGRIEGLEETVALLRSRAVRWRDEFQTMAATAECLADFVQYRIEELQK